MKNTYALILILSLSQTVYPQYTHLITFETPYSTYINIDTSNSDNVWQVGRPDKHLFTSAFSLPNDIITDSINPYPINNNSTFYLQVTPFFYPDYTIEFVYKIDADSINDYGRIEVSFDNGQNYLNFLSVATFQITDSLGNIIFNNQTGSSNIFTGKSNGWYYFTSNIYFPEIPPPKLRFIFHSDSIQNNRDGWMIDNISWIINYQGVNYLSNNCRIYPNPTKEILTIDGSIKISEISILNQIGEILFNKTTDKTPYSIDLRTLDQGVYFLKLLTIDNNTILKKIIKID